MVNATDIHSKEDYIRIVRKYENLFGWTPVERVTKDYVVGMLPCLQNIIDEFQNPIVTHDGVAGYLTLVYDLKKLDIGADYYCDDAE